MEFYITIGIFFVVYTVGGVLFYLLYRKGML